MAFQGIFEIRGQANKLAEIDGSKIVGTKISAPLSVYPEIYVLPMDNVLETKVRERKVDLYLLQPYIWKCKSGYWCRDICPLRLSR